MKWNSPKYRFFANDFQVLLYHSNAQYLQIQLPTHILVPHRRICGHNVWVSFSCQRSGIMWSPVAVASAVAHPFSQPLHTSCQQLALMVVYAAQMKLKFLTRQQYSHTNNKNSTAGTTTRAAWPHRYLCRKFNAYMTTTVYKDGFWHITANLLYTDTFT